MIPKPAKIPKELIETAIEEAYLPCKAVHNSCSHAMYSLHKFLVVLKKVWMFYLPIHFIPIILFKMKELKKKPRETMLNAIFKYIKSLIFMCSCITIIYTTQCLTLSTRKKIDGFNLSLGVFNGSWPVFLEPSGRREEICLYVFPRFLEAFWNLLKHRKLAKPIPGGENLVFGLAIGLIAFYYHKEERAIKPSYKKFFEKFWGVNQINSLKQKQ